MLHSYEVAILCDGSGDATDYAGGTISGKVVAIKYDYGTLAAGTDLTVTGETSTAPIFAITDAGAADNFWWPRLLPNEHADGTAFTDAAGGPPYVFGERIKIVTAQGGAAGAGTITIYVEEDTFAS